MKHFILVSPLAWLSSGTLSGCCCYHERDEISGAAKSLLGQGRFMRVVHKENHRDSLLSLSYILFITKAATVKLRSRSRYEGTDLGYEE